MDTTSQQPATGTGSAGGASTGETPAPPGDGRPALDVTQEVRLAVVMYGGVSLAIYMNGVAEELYHLVRATAPSRRQGEEDRARLAAPGAGAEPLRSTETVYRQLGQLLARGQPLPAGGRPDPNDPIRTRFVVDVLSGTSAGGINAIYLAKALANAQPFDRLKRFWIEEGDIARLINDRESVRDLRGRLAPPERPRSLLNSQRMYVKLLDAFGGMAEASVPATAHDGSPPAPRGYVDEVDLSVTATDIRGVSVPLDLEEALFELRHRHVFRFHYGPDPITGAPVNDFETDNDPYLAFVARCTSAFPFALEPVQETDIPDLLESTRWVGEKERAPISRQRWALWRKFGPVPGSGAADDELRARAYGDGGYLDNKPFGHAIDALAQRQADHPVDRKLLFIDPSPDHPEWARQGKAPPNVIENVAAALNLARYETIRDDLRRVLEGNRLLDKMQRISDHLDDDLDRGHTDQARRFDPLKIVPSAAYVARDLRDMLETWGPAYAALHRVKIADVTDELTAYVAAAAGIDPESEEYAAARTLVLGWRDRRYTRFHATDAAGRPLPTENSLLYAYDFAYRLRRLRFVIRKLDELMLGDPSAADSKLRRALARLFGPEQAALPIPEGAELRALRRELRAVRQALLQVRAELRSPRDQNPLRPLIDAVRLTPEELRALLGRPGESAETVAMVARAAIVLDDPARAAAFDRLLGEIARRTRAASRVASNRVRDVLRGPADDAAEASSAGPAPSRAAGPEAEPPSPADRPPQPATALDAVRAVLWDYYSRYEYFDMAILPTLYGTGVREEDRVDVVRISPEPPRSPGERGDPHGVAAKPSKLGGSSLFHFGAFLDEGWRRSDIMWGRLDGARRLIDALLPGDDPETSAVRERLIAEACCTIVQEELLPADRQVVETLLFSLVAGLRRASYAAGAEAAIYALVREQLEQSPNNPVVEMLRAMVEPAALNAYLQGESYTLHPPAPDPRAMAGALARGTQVVGQLLDDLAPSEAGRQYAALLTRLGRVAWGLVEVAVPRSLPNLLFTHWRNLLTLFGVLLIGFAVIMGSWRVGASGGILVVAMVVLSVVVKALGDYLTKRPEASATQRMAWPALRVVVVVAGTVIALLALLGVQAVADWLEGRALRTPAFPDGTAIVLPLPGLVPFPQLIQLAGLWSLVPAVALLVLVVVRLVAPRRPDQEPPAPREPLPFKVRAPILALELAGTAEQARQVIGASVLDSRRRPLVQHVVVDFVFIGWYALLFLALAFLVFWSTALGGLGLPVSDGEIAGLQALLGIVTGVLGLLAAAADVAENRRLLTLLRTSLFDLPAGTERVWGRNGRPPSPDALDALVASVRRVSLLKWGLTFLTVALLGVGLLGAGGLLEWLAALFLGVAILGLLGIVVFRWRADGRLLEGAFAALMVGLLPLGLLMLARPDLVTAWLGLPPG